MTEDEILVAQVEEADHIWGVTRETALYIAKINDFCDINEENVDNAISYYWNMNQLVRCAWSQHLKFEELWDFKDLVPNRENGLSFDESMLRYKFFSRQYSMAFNLVLNFLERKEDIEFLKMARKERLQPEKFKTNPYLGTIYDIWLMQIGSIGDVMVDATKDLPADISELKKIAERFADLNKLTYALWAPQINLSPPRSFSFLAPDENCETPQSLYYSAEFQRVQFLKMHNLISDAMTWWFDEFDAKENEKEQKK